MDYQQAMLTEINAAVEAGEIVVDSSVREHIQSCTDRMVDGDKSAWVDFTQYLREHQSAARVVGRNLVRIGYRFLDGELERLRQFKAGRPLNESEHEYRLNTLTQLLDAITNLACKTGTPDSPNSQSLQQ